MNIGEANDTTTLLRYVSRQSIEDVPADVLIAVGHLATRAARRSNCRPGGFLESASWR